VNKSRPASPPSHKGCQKKLLVRIDISMISCCYKLRKGTTMDIREVPRQAVNGWTMVGVVTLLGAAVIWAVVTAVQSRPDAAFWPLWAIALFGCLALMFIAAGFFMLPPNMAGVLTLFGRYKGTVRETGLLWANPFYAKEKVSVRTRNFAS